MKLRVQNIQGLTPNFTVTVNEDSDLAFKGGAYLYVQGITECFTYTIWNYSTVC